MDTKNLNINCKDSEEFTKLLLENPKEVIYLINYNTKFFRIHATMNTMDLCHDIYIHILENASIKYDGSLSKASTFIGVCARQYMLNIIRKLKNQEMAVEDIPDQESDASHSSELEMSDLYCKLVNKESDPRMRIILKARFEKSLTLHEIAKLPGVGVSYVRVSNLLNEWIDTKRKAMMSA